MSKLLGKDLNLKYRTYDSIFTPEEIKMYGFVYVPWITFITDSNNILYDSGYCDDEDIKKGKYPLYIRTYKLKHKYSHDWNEEKKKISKQNIIQELKMSDIVFIHKIHLTPFADDMDYSNFSFDIGILVSGAKQKVVDISLKS